MRRLCTSWGVWGQLWRKGASAQWEWPRGGSHGASVCPQGPRQVEEGSVPREVLRTLATAESRGVWEGITDDLVASPHAWGNKCSHPAQEQRNPLKSVRPAHVREGRDLARLRRPYRRGLRQDLYQGAHAVCASSQTHRRPVQLGTTRWLAALRQAEAGRHWLQSLQ